jgi:hypothetical protein
MSRDRAAALRLAPTHGDELVGVKALRFLPEPAISWHVRRIGALRYDAFQAALARHFEKLRPAAPLMIAVLQLAAGAR